MRNCSEDLKGAWVKAWNTSQSSCEEYSIWWIMIGPNSLVQECQDQLQLWHNLLQKSWLDLILKKHLAFQCLRQINWEITGTGKTMKLQSVPYAMKNREQSSSLHAREIPICYWVHWHGFYLRATASLEIPLCLLKTLLVYTPNSCLRKLCCCGYRPTDDLPTTLRSLDYVPTKVLPDAFGLWKLMTDKLPRYLILLKFWMQLLMHPV